MDPQQELQTGQVRELVLMIFYQNIQLDSMKIFRVVENMCMTEKENTGIKQK